MYSSLTMRLRGMKTPELGWDRGLEPPGGMALTLGVGDVAPGPCVSSGSCYGLSRWVLSFKEIPVRGRKLAARSQNPQTKPAQTLLPITRRCE
jgi:hypothetical protein